MNEAITGFLVENQFDKADSLALIALDRCKTAHGESNTPYGIALQNFTYIKLDKGNFLEAAQMAQKAKAVFVEHGDTTSLYYARQLKLEATLDLRLSQQKRALANIDQAISIIDQLPAIDSARYIQYFEVKSIIIKSFGRYQEALNIQENNLKIVERKVGKKHVAYCIALLNLANTRLETGMLERAMNDFEEAKALFVAAGVKDHENAYYQYQYYIFLNNLGRMYSNIGKYHQSLNTFREALEQAERTVGKSVEYAGTQSAFGLVYAYIGDYQNSEEQLLLARENFRAVSLDTFHLVYAVILNNLALSYQHQGKIKDVLKCLHQTKIIIDSLALKGNLIYPLLFNNIGRIYHEVGNYEKAVSTLEAGAALTDETTVMTYKKHILPNLSQSYFKLGNVEKAILKAKEALSFFQEKNLLLTRENIDVTIGLGNMYLELDSLNQAKELFYTGIDLTRKMTDKPRLSLSSAYHGLAICYEQLNALDSTDVYFQKAVNLTSEMYDGQNMLFHSILMSYARFVLKEKKAGLAVELLQKSNDAFQKTVFQNLSLLSEEGKEKYIADTEDVLGRMASMLIHISEFPASSSMLFEAFTQLKGMSMSSVMSMQEAIKQHPNENLKSKYQDWKSLKQILNKQYSLPVADRQYTSEALQTREQECEQLEEDLAFASSDFQKALHRTTWEEIRKSLNNNEALVEFFHFKYYDLNGKPTDSVYYYAMVMKNKFTYPKMVRLFEKSALDQLFEDAEKGYNIVNKTNRLYRSRDPNNRPRQPSAYSLIWEPIAHLLDDTLRVYYVPSGSLHALSFAALEKEPGLRLIDVYPSLEFISSAGELLFPPEEPTSIKHAVLYGGLIYNKDSCDSPYIAYQAIDTTRGGEIGSLYYSLEEVQLAAHILEKRGTQATVLDRCLGTEATFKSFGTDRPSPDLLHFATHAKVLPDSAETQGKFQYDSPLYQSKNPLVRAILVKAKAQDAWNGNPPKAGEDGLLTAFEITAVDLSNTKVAVLSACGSGLGEIKGSEGVYGLQRAFKMAGVDHLLMTLWDIPDSKAPLYFMERFYHHWQGGEQPLRIREAFTKAQKEMKKEYPEPYFWAAFVLI